MKKILGLVLVYVCFISTAVALEDYILISKNPVKKVVSSNKEIVIANILVTVMNEKNTILVQAKSKGKAILTFTINDENFEIPIEIKNNKTIFKKNQLFEIVKIDLPPEMFDIDLPPNFGGIR